MPIMVATPVDNEKNRRFYDERLQGRTAELFEVVGQAELENGWPRPYKNSVPGTCESCKGDVLIGPEVSRKGRQLAALGIPCEVMCHLCAVIASNGEATLVKLSSKKWGE